MRRGWHRWQGTGHKAERHLMRKNAVRLREAAQKWEGQGDLSARLRALAEELDEAEHERTLRHATNSMKRGLRRACERVGETDNPEKAQERVTELEDRWEQVQMAADSETWRATEELLAEVRKAEDRTKEISEALETAEELRNNWQQRNEETEEVLEKLNRTLQRTEETQATAEQWKGEIAQLRDQARVDEEERGEQIEAIKEGSNLAKRVSDAWKERQEEAEKSRERTLSIIEKMEETRRDAEAILGLAEAAGVSRAFTEKEKRVSEDRAGRIIWPITAGVAALSAAGVALDILGSTEELTSGYEFAWQLVGKATAIGILIAVARYAGKQHERWRKTYENYGHKRAVSGSLKAFSEELDRQGTEEEKNEFVRHALMAITEHPETAGTVEGEKKGRGWRNPWRKKEEDEPEEITEEHER